MKRAIDTATPTQLLTWAREHAKDNRNERAQTFALIAIGELLAGLLADGEPESVLVDWPGER